jgi:hypothetical protein
VPFDQIFTFFSFVEASFKPSLFMISPIHSSWSAGELPVFLLKIIAEPAQDKEVN